MKVFVVLDAQGAGRIVGVFGQRALAERVAAVPPPYYSLHEHTLDALDPEAARWLPSDERRRALEEAVCPTTTG